MYAGEALEIDAEKLGHLIRYRRELAAQLVARGLFCGAYTRGVLPPRSCRQRADLYSRMARELGRSSYP